MKPAKIFQQYIWIVNALRQYKKLSLEQLNELWVKDEITECLTPCEVQTNLMGDAAERLGKKIAQFIKKQIE